MPSPTIGKGTCYALFTFEVGQSINLDACERLLPATGRQTLQSRRAPQYFHYRPAPLRLAMDEEPIEVGTYRTRAQVEVVVYDFGAILVVFALPIEGALAGLVRLGTDLNGNEPLLTRARSRTSALVRSMGTAVVKPKVAGVVEDYVIYHVESFAQPVETELFPVEHAQLLTQILRSESQALSSQEVADALGARMSFSPNDLTLVDWNAALVIDPEADETRAVLEFANAQLLEMRFLDQQLDEALEQSYQILAPAGRRRRGILRSHAADLEHLSTLQADSAVLFERITNALKLIGDMYLSRLYRMVSGRFHLDEWDRGITRKLETIESIYQKLSDRASTRRLEVLEWIVILLIAFEIFLTLIGH